MYHPQIVRAVQNHRELDWDAVGVSELEGGAKGVLSSPLMFTTVMTEFFLIFFFLSWS